MVLKGCENEGGFKIQLNVEYFSCLIRNNVKSPSVHITHLHFLVYKYGGRDQTLC
jgi:hypothetical protein